MLWGLTVVPSVHFVTNLDFLLEEPSAEGQRELLVQVRIKSRFSQYCNSSHRDREFLYPPGQD